MPPEVEWYWVGYRPVDAKMAKKRFAGVEIGRNKGRKQGYYMRRVQ